MARLSEIAENLRRALSGKAVRGVGRKGYEDCASAIRGASLEIHVPISPTPLFFNMVRYLAESLRQNGGGLRDAPIVVTVGDSCAPFDLYRRNPWSRAYPIHWLWLDQHRYARDIYYATAIERFCYPFAADNVLLLDADLVIARPIDDLVGELARTPAFLGLPAHVSPFMMRNREHPEAARPNAAWWTALFAEADLSPPDLGCEHPGWGLLFSEPEYRYSPPYFNLGVLLAPRDLMAAIGATIYDDMHTVDRVLTTIYKCQLALTLAVVRSGTPWRPLPLRYNFPTLDVFAKGFPEEFADVRVLHYLGQEGFSKERDFSSVSAVRAFLRRGDVSVSNALLQSVARPLQVALDGAEL